MVVVTVTLKSITVGPAQYLVTNAVHVRAGTIVTVSVIVVVTTVGRLPPAVYVIVRAGTWIVAGGACCGNANV